MVNWILMDLKKDIFLVIGFFNFFPQWKLHWLLCKVSFISALKPNYSKNQLFLSSFLLTWYNLLVQNGHGVLPRLVLSILDMGLACWVLNSHLDLYTLLLRVMWFYITSRYMGDICKCKQYFWTLHHSFIDKL